mmetsp:Transcript_30620/g.46987  ORF Transcript_30620/g.46987 Transcript_30620/m.46987 type:complete len:344 (+) Transcript_30620:279-1310(+)
MGYDDHEVESLVNGTRKATSPSKGKSGGIFRSGHGRPYWWYGVGIVIVACVVMISKAGKMESDSADVTITNKKGQTYTLKHGDIRQISILGERNSGTRWTYAHLADCFNETGIHVTRNLARYKHWFQYENSSRYPADTLIVAQFRNPYDWIEAMHKVPHHSPSHMNLDWKEFVTKTWTTERFGTDLNITDPLHMCQEHFYYRDIISCDLNPKPAESYDHKLHYSENQPFYEMRNDGSGKPYENIMELRADKIRNFMETKDYKNVRDMWVTQYEYLVSKGTKALLDRITDLTGIDYDCKPYEPQNRRKRPIAVDFAKYLNEHLDWDAEELIGYKKQNPEPKDKM